MTDILDDSYESDLTEEEHERLILMSEHAIAKPISPTTQAVLDAVEDDCIHPDDKHRIAAAALRAAADQMRYEDRLGWTGYGYYTHFQNQIRAIASELEAQ